MARREFANKSELENWVISQAENLRRPAVILLDGGLGAGKTQTVRWFCAALGVKEAASPTFAIHHEYASPSGPVDHVDLYRIKDEQELENSGFWDLLKKSNALLFVEWAGRLPDDVWPVSWNILKIKLSNGLGQEARILEWQIKNA